MKHLKTGIIAGIFLLMSGTFLEAQPSMNLSAKNYFEGESFTPDYPLIIREMSLEITLEGPLVKTRIDLQIHNPTETANLEGQLSFLLPESALVSNYALDVEGVMVDGVVVEKPKATASYEAIVAQKIDPGLLQLESGNRFSTRIFPLNEKSSRQLRFEFVTQLLTIDGLQRFRLPLWSDRVIERLTIKVVMPDTGRVPQLNLPSGMQLTFKREAGYYLAEKSWNNLHPEGELILTPKTKVSEIVFGKAADDQHFFLINDTLPKNTAGKELRPQRLGIFWDASLSREQQDHKQELALVREFLARHHRHLQQIDLLVLRHQHYELFTYSLPGEANNLLDFLSRIDYDGATDLSQLNAYRPSQSADIYLLFTDGLNRFASGEDVTARPVPLHIITSTTNARHHYLSRLAAQSGGGLFSLDRQSPEDILQQLTRPVYQFLGATFKTGAGEIYPLDGWQPGNFFPLIGQLTDFPAHIQLHYGAGGKTLHTRDYRLNPKKYTAANGRVLELYWVNAVTNQLDPEAADQRDTIIALSKTYGFATDYTSLLVLENLEQYLEFRIRPPASLPEWVEEYDETLAELLAEETNSTEAHWDELAEQWKDLVGWWKQDIDLQTLPLSNKQDRAQAAPVSSNRIVTSHQSEVLADTGEGVLEEIMVTGIRASEMGTASLIQLQAWTPERPYLKALHEADKKQQFSTYVAQRHEYGQLPAFYLETAEFFYHHQQTERARQIVSNLLEISSADTSLPRVAAYKMLEWGEYDLAIRALEIMLRNHPEQPQSYRDLALALIARADASGNVAMAKEISPNALADYRRAAEYLLKLIASPWDESFEGIQMIALMELNPLLARLAGRGYTLVELDPRLKAVLDVDLRIVINWNANRTDMDLWVTEPAPYGEKVLYSHPSSQIGGRISNDMTQGFGPEEYLLKKAPPGTYQIHADYFGSNSLMPTGPVKVKADIYVNYGRPNQRHQNLVIELEDSEGGRQYRVGEIIFERPGKGAAQQ